MASGVHQWPSWLESPESKIPDSGDSGYECFAWCVPWPFYFGLGHRPLNGEVM